MVLRIFTGSDGQSHFEDLPLMPPDIPTTPRGSRVASAQPAASFNFATAPGTYDWDWHTTPSRRYVIILSGQVEFTVGDESTRRVGPGSVLLAEDLTGQGHRTRAIGKKPFATSTLQLP